MTSDHHDRHDAGSLTSSMAMRLSRLVRRTCITFSQVMRKEPSMPDASMALISIRVSRNGIFSGNLERVIAT
jgi:hypothetical protein